MDLFGDFNDISEAYEVKNTEEDKISKEADEKLDKLMGDDILELYPEQEDIPRLDPIERENNFNKLFEIGDFFDKEITQSDSNYASTDELADINSEEKEQVSKQEGEIEESSQEPDYLEKREPNSKYEFDGNIYETDDNGQTYKKNGEILPNTEYTINGNTYKTDDSGNKISCDSNPEYTEAGSRNIKEQKEAGGEERQEDDDGGHIIAIILGGAEGEENLIPMRRTINRGDYKKMENEIAKALQEGKDVKLHIDIEYDENSSRPLKIHTEYTIDGKKTVCEFDNVEGSTDLLDSLSDKISDEDYDRLKQTLEEMKEDGCEVTITSVKVEYDENGNPTKVTVGILDETTGTKNYKEYSPR